jgi:nicotinamidase-related amidase
MPEQPRLPPLSPLPDTVDAALLGPMLLPARTALVIIDVQNDFVAPDGALGLAGVDMAPLAAPLERIEALIAAARARDVTVVFVRLVTRPETDSNALKLMTARKGQAADSVALCRAGTPGADYYRLLPRAGDMEIDKALYSAFVGTTFERQLRERGLDTLLVCGFTTECCVDSTVRDAFHRDFNVFLAEDACAAYLPDLHHASLNALGLSFALLVNSCAVELAWRSGLP